MKTKNKVNCEAREGALGYYGFTLIEILVVIGIMTVVFLFSSFIFANRQPLVQLDMASSEMLSVLRQAQNQSLARKASSSWGVYFDELNSSVYIMYAGINYQNRDASHDLEFNMGEMISWFSDSTIGDMRFSSVSGFPVSTTTIMIKHDDFSDIKRIYINEMGKIERND